LADQSFPGFSLIDPVRFDRDRADFSFSQARRWVECGRQLENGPLDVRGEVGEVEDLRDAGSGDASGACKLGLILDLAAFEKMVETDGKGHQFGDVGDFRYQQAFGGPRWADAILTSGRSIGFELSLNVAHAFWFPLLVEVPRE
jgi:hypothetical protein